ncbi:MAG: GNAT family N-acetyltransferase [Desulfobacteraceae bacterium]|nr:GNAT family N-acetyltransferase [Desulfobacteraceae bacterium]
MSNDDYKLRRAESSDDADKLHDFFNEIFHPEDVGMLARTIFHSLPGMKKEFWYIAETKKTAEIAAAFALIPWSWEMAGIPLKVAEMGIVGTGEKHRKKGLMKRLNQEFDRTLISDGFDLSVIQGIPGFYNHFGFHYAVPLANHIELPLHVIPDEIGENYNIRKGGPDDIDFFLGQDEVYRNAFSFASVRSRGHWLYLMTESLKTEMGSEFRIIDDLRTHETYYCRIPNQGFGSGLIISEISDGITQEAFAGLLAFLKRLAEERGKPYIRLDLHNRSNAAQMAIAMGAGEGTPYAWQIKVPNREQLLTKMVPLFDGRLKESVFSKYAGTLRLEFYEESIDMKWKNGRIRHVGHGSPGKEVENIFCIPPDLFPALCTGTMGWRELRQVRPDIFPSNLYLKAKQRIPPDETGLLIDVLFPRTRSWIYEQY